MRIKTVIVPFAAYFCLATALPGESGNADLVAQGLQTKTPVALDPAEAARLKAEATTRIARERSAWEQRMTTERNDRERQWISFRTKEQQDFNEKRRAELDSHLAQNRDNLQYESQQRRDWDRRATEVVSIGGQATTSVARDRAEWERQITSNRNLREQDWNTYRNQEQRSYDAKRLTDLDAREKEKRERTEWERQQRQGWDRRARECTNFSVAMPDWCFVQ